MSIQSRVPSRHLNNNFPSQTSHFQSRGSSQFLVEELTNLESTEENNVNASELDYHPFEQEVEVYLEQQLNTDQNFPIDASQTNMRK